MAEDEPHPRRRFSDRERRRWNDLALDQLREDLDDVRNEFRVLSRLPIEVAALSRSVDRLREVTNGDLHEIRDDIKELREDTKEDTAELRKEVWALREENRRQHRNVAYGKDPDDASKELPPRPATLTWGAVAKFAGLVAALFAPMASIIAAIVTHT